MTERKAGMTERKAGMTIEQHKIYGYKIQNYIDRDVDVTVTIGTHYNTCTLNSIET